MKKKALFIFFSLYGLALIIYFPNRGEIKPFIHSYLPPRYNTNNPLESTVFYQVIYVKPEATPELTQIPNSQFKYSPKKFEIDDTDLLEKENLECKPDSFGYSIKRGKEVFKDKIYPKCSKVNGQNETYIHIDRNSNTLYMNCPEGKNNKFLVGPFDDRKLIPREEGYKYWKLNQYTKPIDAKTIEFALGSCDSDGEELLQGNMIPIFNNTAYDNAKKLVKGKPKLAFFLTLDSISRRHFFRKLPDTLDWLNNLNQDPKGEFSVFDFKLQNVMGGDSPDNQVPIFIGHLGFPKVTPGDQSRDFLGEKAIWHKLREKGYVSVIGFESCDDNFIKTIGRKPNVDYSVGPFYCAVERYTSHKFGKGYSLQRCLGGHQSHFYILNYTRTVIELNKGVNVMAYLHINAGHEGTGLHAATLNLDIRDYLSTLLSQYKSDYDIIVFLNGDHGMRYGPWYTELSAFQEQKLPALFVIASKSLLDQHEFSYHSLYSNSFRLVSKLDYRKTVLSLAGIEEDTPGGINLIGQIASTTRSCTDLGVNPYDCACLQMTLLAVNNSQEHFFLEQLRDYAENTINLQGHSDKLHFLGQACKKISLSRIENVYHIGINSLQEIIKLELSSDTRKGLKYAVNFFVSSDNTNMGANKQKLRVESLVYKGKPVKARILLIMRMDQYAGNCEIEARRVGIKAEYCA